MNAMTDMDKKDDSRPNDQEPDSDIVMGQHYNPYLWAGSMSGGADEGTQARAGAPKEAGVPVATEAAVVEALRRVHDPEIPVNIYDLGLIYEHDIDAEGNVAITMTLTAPACPVAGEMPGQVAQEVAKVEGVGETLVTLTWEPAWNPSKMSEDAKLALGIF